MNCPADDDPERSRLDVVLDVVPSICFFIVCGCVIFGAPMVVGVAAAVFGLAVKLRITPALMLVALIIGASSS